MAAEEKASQRQIGRTLGVDESTVREDLGKRAAGIPALPPAGSITKADSEPRTAGNPAVPRELMADDLSGTDAAKAAKRAGEKAAATDSTDGGPCSAGALDSWYFRSCG